MLSVMMILLLAMAVPKAASAQGPGPWCTGALQGLSQARVSGKAAAAYLLRAQSIPTIVEKPRRRVFVSSDAAQPGNGTSARPFRNLQVAINKARPGDRIIVRPGQYNPVVVRASGTAANRITIAAQSNGTRRAVIDGTGRNARGLIEIRAASYVTVSGFRLQNAPRDGVFVEGTRNGERGIRILDNDIDTTGNSGIYAAGVVMRYVTGVDEYRLFDVLIQGNRVRNTNYPNGVNEAITIGGGVDGFIVRNNYVFETRQYGIDAKAGAINGSITDNVIRDVKRHGIYLDAGSRRLAHIDVRRNAIFGVRNGIVLARESGRDPRHPNLHNINVVDNLVFDSTQFGIKAYRHKDDSGRGRFDDVNIRQNCICGIERDAIRLGGIRNFANSFRVESNMISSSGGTVWNRIGAAANNNGNLRPALNCPG